MVEVYKSKLTEFIQSFFLRLEQENVQYCILRNYADLPQNLQGGDIDILVSPEQIDVFDNILVQVSEEYDLIVIQKIRLLTQLKYKLLNRTISLDEPGLAMDVVFGLDWRGLEYLSVEELLTKRRRYKDFYILDQVHEAFIVVFDRILWGELPKDKYFSLILDNMSKCRLEWEILIKEAFGSKISRELVDDIERMRFKRILGYARQLRFRCFLKNFLSAPFVSLFRFSTYHIFQFINYVRYGGIFLAFVGPDGVGKSTLIEKCSDAFSRLRIEPNIFHWRPSLMQPLSAYRKYLGGSEGGWLKGTSGTLGSIFRLIYYTFDYIFGYLFCVLPSLKRGEVVIFDRYFYDYLVDPERIRTAFLGPLSKIASLIIPKPDLVIALYANPSNIHKRKPELSEEEIGRQITGFRLLSGFVKTWVSISTDGQAEKSAKEAFSVITFSMSASKKIFKGAQSRRVMTEAISKSRLKKKLFLSLKSFLDGLQHFIPIYSVLVNFTSKTRRYFLREFGAIIKLNASIEGRLEIDDPSLFQLNQRAVAANLKVCGSHCCLIDHDARAISIRNVRDSIVTKHNIYQGDDKVEKTVTLSIDLDGAVGLAHVPREEFEELRLSWDETIIAERILLLLKAYKIPTVWAISGHLFLDQCDTQHPYHESEWYGDWFLFDPGTDYNKNPEWYMPNFIKKLIQEPLFEIAYHSFAHFTYSRCSSETVARDMEFSGWIRKQYGIPLETFIFPHGTIGYIDEIVEGGFTNLRGGFGRRAIAKTIDFGKFSFYCTSRLLNLTTVDECGRNIDEILGKNFNYYTHPWEWKSEKDLVKFERFLDKLANMNGQGDIHLQCMRSPKSESEISDSNI